MYCNSYKLFIFSLTLSTSVLILVISSPIPNLSPYDKFVKFLSNNNCSMPKEIKLPFPNSSDPSLFNYLSAPLKECQSSELKEYDEANMLCTEVFDVLKNITCVEYNEPLPVIESEHLSENVCQDFESLNGIIPKRDNYLSGRLSDKLICKVLCSAENFEPLCTTLLWSYNTLLKIQHVLSSEAQIQENPNQDTEELSDKDPVLNGAQIQEDKNLNKASPKEVVSVEKSSSTNVESDLNSENMKKTIKSKIEDLHPDEETLPISNPNQIDQEIHKSKVSDDLGEISSQVVLNKDLLNPQSPDGVINQTTSTAKNSSPTTLENKSQPDNQKLTPGVTENSIKPIESKNLPSPSSPLKHLDDTENKISDEKLTKKVINITPKASSSKNSSSNVNGVKENIKNKTTNSLLNNGDDKDIANIGSKTSEKTVESVASSIENNDNEVKNNFPEEDKSKTKPIDIENKEIKDAEKQKQTDYEGPNEVLPENDSKLPESSTQLALPDEDIEHQDDKDQDQYNNDIENEGEEMPEYDLPPKIKESGIKNSISAGSNQHTNGYDNSNMNTRNNIGRISEEIAMIAPFPEQEDSHFFFYFLSIVLIIMAGYLIFHNKQKIIALIVEGRHERRRRSHGAGYKKLETK